MASSFSSFEIARSGMFVNERALYVTGHNISNVNTHGYVRQQAMIETAPYITSPLKNGLMQIGLGADIQQIRQIRHIFLDNIYRQENTTLGYWETRSKTFQDVQAILGEPMGIGLQSIMNEFWNAWHELSKDPDSLTARAVVRQRGEALVNHINHLGKQLDRLQNDLNSEVAVRVDEVNSITARIAELNEVILKSEISGDNANDYRDQRNVLLDRLSKLVDAEIIEMQDGQVNVTLGGYFLVNKNKQTRLYVDEKEAGALFYVLKLEGTDVVISPGNGIIKGLMESRGEVSGALGSYENGTPNTKADIVFVFDLSQGSGAAYLDKLISPVNPPLDMETPIEKYINDLNRRGIDYELQLVTFDGTAALQGNYGKDTAAFISAVNSLAESSNPLNNFGEADGVVPLLTSIPDFRADAAKHAIIFTHESIGGDEGADIDSTMAREYLDALSSAGINVSMVVPSNYFSEGFGTETVGWDSISKNLHDIDSASYESLMVDIASDVMTTVNRNISTIKETNNIISDLKRRLNAIVNIMAREINYLHRSGKTLGTPPVPGEDFFTAIDPSYPIEMGNIRLNPIFSTPYGLNNIVASATGDSGNNEVALKIANLRHEPIMADLEGVLSLDEYYQAIILNVGNYGLNAERICENQTKLVTSADLSRQAITGVSMDEEMANMLKYKFAYNASSRVFNIIDEMIETVVSRMGLTGR